MRASENNMEKSNQSRSWGSIIKDVHANDPKVIERFERSPYYPVLNFERGETNERKTESEEV